MRVRLRLSVPKPDWSTESRRISGDVDLVLEEGGLVFLHHPGESFTKAEMVNVDGRIRVEVVEVEADPSKERA